METRHVARKMQSCYTTMTGAIPKTSRRRGTCSHLPRLLHPARRSLPKPRLKAVGDRLGEGRESRLEPGNCVLIMGLILIHAQALVPSQDSQGCGECDSSELYCYFSSISFPSVSGVCSRLGDWSERKGCNHSEEARGNTTSRR